jgi:hypothetical protein
MGKVLVDVLQVVVYLFVCTSCSFFLKHLCAILQDIPGSNILADGVLIDEKSAVLFLAFLSSHLTIDKRLVIFFLSISNFLSFLVLKSWSACVKHFLWFI